MRTTRRKFLSVVGLAAAGPLILPRASALGYARNEAVRVGMIGMGVRGREILHGYLLGNSRVRVVAICDVDTTRREHHTRERFAAEYRRALVEILHRFRPELARRLAA